MASTSCSTVSSLISQADAQSANSTLSISTSNMIETMGPINGLITYGLAVDITPQNITASLPYTLELYERGQLRTTQSITFTTGQINFKQVVTVFFPLTDADFNGVNTVDYPSIFNVKIIGDTPTTTKGITTTTQKTTVISDIATVIITYMSPTENDDGSIIGYFIIVEFKPSILAKANTKYTVNLYQNGQYRDTASYSWSQSDLSSAVPGSIMFPATAAEYQQYGQQYDLSNIFSVKFTQ